MRAIRRLVLSTVVFTVCLAVNAQGKPKKVPGVIATCSNIVALSGDAKVNCSSLTPEQAKLLRQIPVLLKKLLANPQLNSDLVMSKLDEIIALSAQATPMANAPGGIAVIGSPSITQTSSAPCTAQAGIGNATVNNCQVGSLEPEPRILREADVLVANSILRGVMDAPKYRILVINPDDESVKLGDRLWRIFKDAGWLPLGDVTTTRSFQSVNGRQSPAFEGIACVVNPAKQTDASVAMRALNVLKVPCSEILPYETPQMFVHGKYWPAEPESPVIQINIGLRQGLSSHTGP